ncbi:MAG: mechanosensitive ion channel family protein [Gammaproteobacteria bacterium]|nr:mechanosensitive ion channel family protein [Gammaproteobacteria bacterium]
MDSYQETILGWAGLLGPNPYVQAAAIAVAFIIIGKIAEFVLSRLILKIVSRSKTEFDDAVVNLLHRPIFISFVLVGLTLATYRLPMPERPEFITLGLLKTIAIVVWYNFLRGLVRLILGAFKAKADRSQWYSGMLPLINNVVTALMVALSAYFIFLAWNFDIAAWLGAAGIIGLALSFAAKDTLSNLFAGVSIAADAPYKEGDFIILDTGERGMVTHIGLRSTRLLTRDDVEITIPNGVIGNAKITNEAGGPSTKHRIRVKVGVAYGSDIDLVIEVLGKVAQAHSEVCRVPDPRVRFRGFGDSSLDVELLCWIDRPVDRGRLSHELYCAVYKGFIEHNIEIPFPQRDLHLRTVPAQGIAVNNN